MDGIDLEDAVKHTEETKRKLSAMRRGALNPFHGRTHTAETRAKIAAANRGRSGRVGLAPLSVTTPTGTLLGYLAGLIDGEGSIGVRAAGGTFLSVYNTELVVMEWLTQHVGGSVGGSPDRRGRALCYCWTLQRARDVIAVVRVVEPYLLAKTQDAQTVRTYLEATYGL